jgi:L-asparaginase II
MNLLGDPPPVLLPDDPQPRQALEAGEDPSAVAARWPASSAAWAALARRARDAGEPVNAYAYARTGYHRGLDALRRSGWKGYGPVPFEHAANRGVLGCIAELSRAAEALGETDEAARCRQMLADADPDALDRLLE